MFSAMTAMLSNDEIRPFIPQRKPFVMVDKLYEINGSQALTGFHISPENLLVKNGDFQESGLVENIAQSAALLAGYHASNSGEAPRVGYIGMIKDLKIYQLPKSGEEIYTEVAKTAQIMNAEIILGKVMNSAKKLYAECELRVFFENDGTSQ